MTPGRGELPARRVGPARPQLFPPPPPLICRGWSCLVPGSPVEGCGCVPGPGSVGARLQGYGLVCGRPSLRCTE